MQNRENPKKKGKNGKCRLCLRQADLCRSHIIPEFHYGPLYDQNHQMHVLATGTWNGPTKIQKGIWERLLCKCCEAKISRWESYASSVIFQSTTPPDIFDDALVFRNIDYTKFKLYQLSILWRFGITSKYGYRIDLGEHAEVLRQMLLEEKPGRPNDYPCWILFPQNPAFDLKDWIQGPEKRLLDDVTIVRTVINGRTYIFFLDPLPDEAPKNLGITESGVLPIYRDQGKTMEYLEKLAVSLAAKGKLPRQISKL